MDLIDQVIGEILQMKEQYATEVQGPRRQWPKSIKERVLALVDAGVRMKLVGQRAGIPYETITQWRTERRRSAFVELAVTSRSMTVPEIVGTVTVPTKEVTGSSTIPSIAGRGITVRTPDGYVVEVESFEVAVALIERLRAKVVTNVL